MKIGILTQPLINNYGGILQAFALQKVLCDQGHEVWFINRLQRQSVIRKLASKIKAVVLRYLLKKKISYRPSKREIEIISVNTKVFIEQYFPNITKELYSRRQMVDILDMNFDAIIVGSDQVWRKSYSPDIFNYFLDFIPKEKRIKRISYAASFGYSDWEYSVKETAKLRKLAYNFDAISVREERAVVQCEKFLSIKAKHVLDPTMLLSCDNYISILSKDNMFKYDNILTSYILDHSELKQKVVEGVAHELNIGVYSVMAKKSLNRKSKKDIKNCIFPPVSEWLIGFVNADFVITDSFHGTVFSILFNKPFITFENDSRGNSRFLSLLKMFNLENRLVSEYSISYLDILRTNINWQYVNSILYSKRAESMTFISQSLK